MPDQKRGSPAQGRLAPGFPMAKRRAQNRQPLGLIGSVSEPVKESSIANGAPA